MNSTDATRRFHELADLAASASAASPSSQALKGMYLGALHGLCRAMELRYRDGAVPDRRAYAAQLTKGFRRLSRGHQALKGQWLAGFYFNDGLFRLSAVYARSLKIATKASGRPNISCLRDLAVAKGLMKPSACQALSTVQQDVNDLKHNDGLLPSRRTNLATAVSAAEEAVELLRMALK
jgi:hypothetical protein